MNAQLELLEWERWGHLAPLMHWSLLFLVRRICSDLQWYLCWGVTWTSRFDLALEDLACLPPYPGFWGNLLTTDMDDVEKTLWQRCIKIAGALSTLISHFFMRFVLVLLTCHQVGHDSNVAGAVVNAGASLQRAIFSSQGCCREPALAKNALEWFQERCCLWWNLHTSCLSSGRLIVLTRIRCDLSSRSAVAVTAVLSVSDGSQARRVGDSSSLLTDTLGCQGGPWPSLLLDFFLCHPILWTHLAAAIPIPAVCAPALSLRLLQQYLKHLPDLSPSAAELYFVASLLS